MTFSVVIPSHNRADLLALCLQSLLEHAPPDTQILVVDDGSPAGIVSKVVDAFPGAECLRLPERSGFCSAANAGLRSARGDIVELLNDDTQVSAGWADASLAPFADPAVGAVAPLVLQGVPGPLHDAVIDSAGDAYHPGGFARKRGHNRRLADTLLSPCPVFGASGSSAFYRRSALETVGLFPEAFGAYFEDVDLAHRLNRAGFRTHFEPASVVWHRVGSTHGRRPDSNLLERQSRNEELVFWRNMPARHLPLHAAVLAAKSLRRLREGTLVPFLKGRLRAFAEIRQAHLHRLGFDRNFPRAARLHATLSWPG